MEQAANIVKLIKDFFWDNILLYLLCGTGIYFTVRLRFIQLRKFGAGIRQMFSGFSLKGKKADHRGMSSFQALTTAIAAQVGTGNITGLRDRSGLWRTGRDLLDVGERIFRDGDHLQ